MRHFRVSHRVDRQHTARDAQSPAVLLTREIGQDEAEKHTPVDGCVSPAEMGLAAATHSHLPLVARKPSEFKAWNPLGRAAGGGNKAAYLKYQAIGVAEDMYMLPLHFRACALGCYSVKAGLAEQKARKVGIYAFGIRHRSLPIKQGLLRSAHKGVIENCRMPCTDFDAIDCAPHVQRVSVSPLSFQAEGHKAVSLLCRRQEDLELLDDLAVRKIWRKRDIVIR